jgi:hypothetical protein
MSALKVTDADIYRALQDAASTAPKATREAICEAVHRKLVRKGIERNRITKIWDAKFGIAWAL